MADNLFWSLPGPSGFVRGVLASLREGRSTALLFPVRAPAGLDAALATAIREIRPLETHDASAERLPALSLFERYWPDAPAATVRNAKNLLACEEFLGRLLWLSGLTDATWPPWRDFLAEYEQVCRSVPQLCRTLFVVPLTGPLTLDAPPAEVCMACHAWRGRVAEMDMLLYCALSLHSSRLPARVRHLAAAVVANLALWDPDTADALWAVGPWGCLAPQYALAAVGRARGWTAKTPASWEEGTLDPEGHGQRTHSALLAVRGEEAEVSRRVWVGLVQVLLPLIEERRLAVLPKVQHRLRFPIRIDSGEFIEDARDLEIGPLCYFLAKAGLSRRDLDPLYRMKSLRNAIAHGEVPPIADIRAFLEEC